MYSIEEGKALEKTLKFEYGYILGVGSKYKRYSFEYRYEVGTGMSDSKYVEAITKRSFFLLGYNF